jgi:hypothetical protein
MKKSGLICKIFIMAAVFIFATADSLAQTQTYTANGNFTVPAGVYSIIVECWGAGGGGGSSNSNGGNPRAGGGGGGGGYSKSIISVTPGNSFNIVVGSGGAGGNAGAGAAGGNSTFNVTTVVANAGTGGGRGGNGTAGAGATAGTGTTLYTGGSGAAGVNGTGSGGGGGGAGSTGNGGIASGTTAGTGTALNGGNGGAGKSGVSSAGSIGNNYGGGGSGGFATAGTGERNGGAGAGGLVIITWAVPYYSQASGNPSTLSNWNSNPGGGGSTPANFTSNNQAFIIQNGHTMTTTATVWNVSGTNTKVEIQSGGTLTESTSAISLSANTSLLIDDGSTLNHNVASLSIFSGIVTIGNASTVRYGLAGAQTVYPATYGNLILLTSGAKTTTSVTVNGVLSMEGTATASAAPAYGASATLQYNTATSRTSEVEWITPFTATGGVIIANTGTITLNGSKVFNTGSPLTINSGASLNTSAANNYTLSFGGDYINNGGTLTANASAITVASTMTTQSIAGFTTTGTVSMTKTAGTATFTGNVNGSGLTINGSGGTLNLGAGLMHIFTGTWTNSNGTLNGGSSLLNIGNNGTFTAGSFVSGTGTVNYTAAGAQTVAGVVYNNLIISGSGTKSLGGSATVAGTLTLGGGTFAVGANTLTLNGPSIAGTPNNLSTTASSTIVLGGTSAGITLPSSVANLNNLIISNPNGVSLSGPLSSGSLTFTSGILNTSSTNLLTITNSAVGSIGGASATSYINGPLARTLLAGQTNYGTPYLFPVGDGADYRPLELLNITTGVTTPVIYVSESVTGALTGDETTISIIAPRNWYVQNLSGDFTSAFLRLTENGLDFTKVIGQSAAQSGNYVSVGGSNIGTSITSTSAFTNASLPAYFAIGVSTVTTYYSYQSGDWNSSDTWTIDPSGSLWIAAAVPGPADNVVILNGRTVTINQNGKNCLSLEIKLGGTLDLQATNTHNFGTVTGQGSLKLSSGTFPGGDYTGFVAVEGGTVEYYNLNNTGISSTQLTYNNLIISNYTAAANTVFLNNATNPINYNLNGNFDLNNNASGSLYFYFGDSTPSDNLINMVVNGNFSIGTGCNIRVNNFASSHTLPNPNNTTTTFPIHSLSVYGDFTNNGTVRFTGLPSPFNNAYYTLGVTAYGGTNYGDVQVYFKGATDNTLTCNGITDFFRLIVQKGTDQTNELEVVSSGTNNFALYAPNNQGNNNAGGGSVGDYGYGVYYKALLINYGTLKLNLNINIPSLTEGGEDYNLLPTAALWINGANVSSTVTGLNGTGYQAATLYGALRISAGQFSTGDAAGLVLMQYGAPSILIEGSGVLDVSQTWSATGATNIASYTQKGGTVNIRLQGENHAGPMLGLSSTNSVFDMSGGTLNFTSNGGGTNFQLMNIAAQTGNYKVTGGTVNLNLPSSGTVYTAISSVPFYDMNLTNQSGSGTVTVQWSAPSPLTILNNLTIGSNSVLDLSTNTIDLNVGHNFNLNGTYTAGNNTTTFNGNVGQVFSNAGTITTSLNNFVLENASNTNITNNLTIRGALTINSSCFLNDQGNTISVAGNITNSGVHTSQANGGIILNGTGVQTIGGSGTGVFGNFALNKASGTSTFSSNQFITGNLRLVSGILDINRYNLALSANSNIYDVLTGTPVPTTFGDSKMITTTGQYSDGGLTKTFNAIGSFLYPVGAGTGYHPGTISFSQVPATWGDVTVRPVANVHPLAIIGNEVMIYYWKVTSNLITGIQPGSVSHTYKYVAADVGPSINSYVTGVFNPFAWVRGATAQVDKINRNILFPGISIIDGDYTAGTPVGLGGVKVFYSHRSGDWDTQSTWSNVDNNPASPDATSLPGVNDAVVIGDGVSNNHVVTISANGKSVGTLGIASGSTLDLKTTTGHNFVVFLESKVSGLGTLRLASGSFPSGDFGDFLGPNGGTIEYYTETSPSNIGSAFTVPATYLSGSTIINITNYCNLILSPATGKNITLPNIDLGIYKDFKVNVSGTSVSGIAQLNNQNTTRTLTINRNLIVNNGNLQYMNGGSTAQNVIVNGDVVIASGAIFDVASALAATNTLTIQGDLTNNGIFDMIAGGTQICNVTFTGSDNKQIKGTTAVRTDFNILTVNKGTDRNSILETTINAFSLNTLLATALTISNGTFRLSTPLTITLTTSSPFTIPISGCLSANIGTINIGAANNNAADLILQGRLEVMNSGVINIGNGSGSNNDIEYAAAGNPEINISGGSLNVDGQIRRNTINTLGSLWFNQSGGTITVKGNNLNTSRGSFEVVNSGSIFNISGGNLIIVKAGSITYADILITPQSSTVNNSYGGHTLIIGNATTPASQVFKLNTSAPLWNLTVDGTTQNKTVNLSVNPLSLLDNLTINGNGAAATGSVFNAKELNVTIGGSLTNNNLSTASGAGKGGYQAGSDGSTQTTTFTGTGTITGTGSNLTNFANLVIGSSSTTPSITLGLNSNIMVNNDLTLASGTLSDAGNTITIDGNIANSAVHSSPSTPGGGIVLASGKTQTISGSGSGSFGNITINNATGVDMVDDSRITGQLNLSLGSLYIDDYKLIMDVNASFSGPFDFNHMIESNGDISDRGVLKYFSGSATGFVFPIGSKHKYRPATFTFTSANGGSINVVPVALAHPADNTPTNDQLNYYWKVLTTGFSGLTSSSQIYQYGSIDVQGNENNYHGALFRNFTWTDYGTSVINSSVHTITINRSDLLAGEYTAGNIANFTVVHKLYSLKSGNWNDGLAWAEDLPTNPPCGYYPNGNPVFVQFGHTITMNINNAYAYSVNIEGTLDLGVTSFHNLGYIMDTLHTGTGKMMLKNTSAGMYIFPGGNYDAFMASPGTTVELYGTTNSSLPLKPGNIYKPYQNLVLTGSGIKYMSAENLKILGNLTFNNGARLNNTSYNTNLYILGNWNDLNAASSGFVPGTGLTSFEGNSAQNIALSNVITENFYDLSMNNAAGLTILGAGKIIVSDLLSLNSGVITTSTTNSLTLTNANSSAVLGGSMNSFINGPLRKQISSGSNFMFPVGKTGTLTRYGNIFLSDIVTAGVWEVEYFNSPPPYDITIKMPPISHVSNNEYWRVNGITGGLANVKLRWDASSGYAGSSSSTRSKIRVVEWNPSGTPSAQWEYRGKVLNDVSDVSGTVATDNIINLAPGADLHYLTIGDEGLPTATITSPLTATICNDGVSSTTVTVALTGTPPWSITYRLGAALITLNNIASSPVSIILTSDSPGITQPISTPTLFNFNITNVNDLIGTPGITNYIITVGIIVNPVPTNTISGKTLVGTGEVVLYSTPSDANTYSWTLSSNGVPLTRNTADYSVTWGSGTPGPYTISLIKTAANGCQVTNSIQVTTSTTPTPVITGSQYVCAGSTGHAYSTPNVAGHDYTWTILPAGAGTITSGGGTSSIIITWNGASAGNSVNVSEHVTSSGSPGIFTNASLPVDIGVQPSSGTPSYSAPASVCNGSTAAININNSENGVRYQLRLNSDNSNVGTAIDGNGGTITLNSTAITSNTTYNIYAYTLAPYNCSAQLTNPALSFVVNALPVLNYGTLSGGDQAICSMDIPNNISFSTAPSGGSGTFGYQWYSYTGLTGTCPTGTTVPAGWILIPAAISDNYTPPALAGSMSYAVMVTPTGSPACVPARWAGGCRQVTVTPLPTASISYSGSPWCITAGIQNVTLTGTMGGTFSAPAGLSINGTTGAINPGASAGGTYTVTYTIPAGGGCGIVTATTQVTVVADLVWTGAVSTDWNVQGNWSCGFIPVSATLVEIPDVTNKPVLSSGAVGTVNNIIIDNGSSLTVSGNTIQISGTITNNGTFTTTDGTVELNGSATQVIGANVFTGNTINGLIVNNPAGVTLQGPLNITGLVTLQNGDLSSGGNLTLISDASQTGLINGSGVGSATGNVTMQRYLSSGFGYKYISSPFQNATVSELGDEVNLASSFPPVYRYDENRTSSGWVSYVSPVSALNPMQGYAVNFGSSALPLTADITGVVTNGSVSQTLVNHNNTYTKGFNLVGNPYPSPIDWDAPSGWTKTNIDNALYYFKASTTDQYGGTYSTYINGTSSDGLATGIIPSMQGFFVHVSDGTWPVTGILGMTNSVRVTDLTHNFLKKGSTSSSHLLRLSVCFADDLLSADPYVIYLDEKATDDFDNMLDALKLMNTDLKVPNIYGLTKDGTRLSINALQDSVISAENMPLGLKLNRDGKVVFKVIDSDIPSLYDGVYLTDAVTNMETKLTDIAEYQVNLLTGEYLDRFYLNAKSIITRINESGTEDYFKIYMVDGRLNVIVNTLSGGAGIIRIYNLTGQILFIDRIYAPGHYEFDPGLKEGMYIVSLITGKELRSKKIYFNHR